VGIKGVTHESLFQCDIEATISRGTYRFCAWPSRHPSAKDVRSTRANWVAQVWQLGDVARYAPSLILGEHLRHVVIVRVLARIDVRERLAIGVADFKATGNLLIVHGGGNLRSVIARYCRIASTQPRCVGTAHQPTNEQKLGQNKCRN
jgi:hypothetical protein